jgi:hypothetical protein
MAITKDAILCNLYAVANRQPAIIALGRAMHDRTGNLPPVPGIFPDYQTPIVRNSTVGRQLVMGR